MLFIPSRFLLFTSLISGETRSSFNKRPKNNGEKNGNEIYGWNHMEQIAFISRLSFAFVEINSQSIYLTECLPFFSPLDIQYQPRRANVHLILFALFFCAVTCFSCHLWIYDLAIFYCVCASIVNGQKQYVWKNHVRYSNKIKVLALFLAAQKEHMMKTSANQFDQTKKIMIIWIKYHNNNFIGRSVFNR